MGSVTPCVFEKRIFFSVFRQATGDVVVGKEASHLYSEKRQHEIVSNFSVTANAFLHQQHETDIY